LLLKKRSAGEPLRGTPAYQSLASPVYAPQGATRPR